MSGFCGIEHVSFMLLHVFKHGFFRRKFIKSGFVVSVVWRSMAGFFPMLSFVFHDNLAVRAENPPIYKSVEFCMTIGMDFSFLPPGEMVYLVFEWLDFFSTNCAFQILTQPLTKLFQ